MRSIDRERRTHPRELDTSTVYVKLTVNGEPSLLRIRVQQVQSHKRNEAFGDQAEPPVMMYVLLEVGPSQQSQNA